MFHISRSLTIKVTIWRALDYRQDFQMKADICGSIHTRTYLIIVGNNSEVKRKIEANAAARKNFPINANTVATILMSLPLPLNEKINFNKLTMFYVFFSILQHHRLQQIKAIVNPFKIRLWVKTKNYYNVSSLTFHQV